MIVAKVMGLEEKDRAHDRAIASLKAESEALRKENEEMKARLVKIEKQLIKKQ